jgi:small neutral amino acid transporter SnatA (MarC family)
MAVRGTSRTSRQRKRVRRRALGAILVLLGILLWGGTALMRATAGHFAPEAIIYLGITVGGAAVVGGILLFSTTL